MLKTFIYYLLFLFCFIQNINFIRRKTNSFESDPKITFIFYHIYPIFYTPDCHYGTRSDFSSALNQFNVKIIFESKFPRYDKIEFFKNKIPNVILELNQPNSFRFPNVMMTKDYQKMRLDIINKYKVSTVLCAFMPHSCINFWNFNVNIIIIACHRLFLNICTEKEQRNLLNFINSFNLSKKRRLIFAGGKYDQKYIQYFTGIKPKIIKATALFYINESYSPETNSILIAPFRFKEIPFKEIFLENKYNYTFEVMKKRFKYCEITKFKAVVILPYAVLSYYIEDLYAMNMPILVPSPEFLYTLRLIVDRRNSDNFYCSKKAFKKSFINNTFTEFNPESNDKNSSLFWYNFADFYQYPYISTFSSWNNLFELLNKINFWKISKNMKKYNKELKYNLTLFWGNILKDLK